MRFRRISQEEKWITPHTSGVSEKSLRRGLIWHEKE